MKQVICGILAAGVLLLGGAYPADAWRGGGFRHGGFQHGRFHHGGFHHRNHGRVFIGSRIFLGAPFWPGPWYRPYPSPPVIVQQTPPVYVQQNTPDDAATYWYYCEQARAYYPYVKECPGGWMTVVPPTTAPAP